jgi:PPE-repeat protein
MSIDFGALPPEINSGRIYSGPGSAPLLAAAAAWDGLASELQTTAASYGSTVAELTSTGWHGPSSAAFVDAAAPYTAWLSSTAAQAEEAGFQAKAAAGAYEAAFAATVPPPVIATNRVLLATLIATNILGQNTAAIAANEATYAEYWAQDAVAMYSYAGSAAAASQLTSFSEPPPTTNGSTPADAVTDALTNFSAYLTNLSKLIASQIAQLQTQVVALTTSALSQAANLIAPSTWTGVTLPTDYSNVIVALSNLNTALAAGPYTPFGLSYLAKNWYQVSISIPNLGVGIQGIGPLVHPKGLTGVFAPLLRSDILTAPAAAHASGVSAVTGATGRAGLIGSLSVPNSWAAALPAVRLAATSMPETMAEAAPAIAASGRAGMFGETALASLAGRAFGDTATRSVSRNATRAVAGNIPRFTNGVVAEDDSIATTATIIVIPPNSE